MEGAENAAQNSRPARGAKSLEHRCPRKACSGSVQARFKGGTLEGCIVNLSYSGVLIHGLDELPEVGEAGEVTVTLRFGDLRARGVVVRVEQSRRRYAVEFTHLGKNANLILGSALADVGTGGAFKPLAKL